MTESPRKDTKDTEGALTGQSALLLCLLRLFAAKAQPGWRFSSPESVCRSCLRLTGWFRIVCDGRAAMRSCQLESAGVRMSTPAQYWLVRAASSGSAVKDLVPCSS